jgi:hypothetical protein
MKSIPKYLEFIRESASPQLRREAHKLLNDESFHWDVWMLNRGFVESEIGGDEEESGMAYVREHIEEWLNSAVSRIESFLNIKEGKFQLWRSVAIDDAGWLTRFMDGHEVKLGKFWTVDVEAAKPYNASRGSSDAIFEALVSPSSVNWYETFQANLDQSFGEDESEIRLVDGAPIKLVTVKYRSHENEPYASVKVRGMKSVTFRA